MILCAKHRIMCGLERAGSDGIFCLFVKNDEWGNLLNFRSNFSCEVFSI
jgi:hypothetical protein